MKINSSNSVFRSILLCVCLFISIGSFAQDNAPVDHDFWKRVQFGGGFGASIGTGYTDITLAPGAIYNFNRYFAAGIGLQGSYVKVKNNYHSYIYGGSIVGLVNPIEAIQLSVELEQVRVNSEFQFDGANVTDNFWNTALFVGAGYRMDHVTIGARYNLLHDRDRSVYYDPFMPFIRIYF